MPQADIPVEASDELVFTPPSLARIEGAPSFTLRAFTHRDHRHHRRLMREAGLVRHTDEDIRAVTRAELERLWSADDYAAGIARLDVYWTALDDWNLARKDEPELTFDYDSDELAAIDGLSDNLFRASETLRRMVADNADAGDLSPVLLVAAVVKDFAGLAAKRQIEGGYLTLECAYKVRDALAKFENERELTTGAAWLDLMVACVRRMNLDADTAKNSGSPSPSEPDQQSSSKEQDPGQSPAATAKRSRSTVTSSAA